MINRAIERNKKMSANYELLLKAGEEDCPSLLKSLIDNGANVNFTDEYGYTPIMHALYKEKMENVRFLLSVKADIFIHTKRGETVFSIGLSEIRKLDFNNLLEENLLNRTFSMMNNLLPKKKEQDVLDVNLKNQIRERFIISYAKYLSEPLLGRKKTKTCLENDWYEINDFNPFKQGYVKVDVIGKCIAIKKEKLEAALEAVDPLETFMLKIRACIALLEEGREVDKEDLEEEESSEEEAIGEKAKYREILEEEELTSEEAGDEEEEIKHKEIEAAIEKEERANELLEYRQKNILINIVETLALEAGDLEMEAKIALKAFLIVNSFITEEDLATVRKIRTKLFHLSSKILEKDDIKYFLKKPWRDVSEFLIRYLKRIDEICRSDGNQIEVYSSIQDVLQPLDEENEEKLPAIEEEFIENYLMQIINSSYKDSVSEKVKFHFLINFYPFFNNGSNRGTLIGKKLSSLRNEIIHEFHTHDAEHFNRQIIKFRELMFIYVYCRKILEFLEESLDDSFNESFDSTKDKLFSKMKMFNNVSQWCCYVPEDEVHFGLEKIGKEDWKNDNKEDVTNSVLRYIRRNIFSGLYTNGKKITHIRSIRKAKSFRRNSKYLEWKKFTMMKANKIMIENTINIVKFLMSLRDNIPIRKLVSLYEDYLYKAPRLFEETLINNNIPPVLFNEIPKNPKAIFSYKGRKYEKKFIYVVENIMSYFRSLYSCTPVFDRIKDAFNNEIVLDYLFKFYERKKNTDENQHKRTVLALIKTVENWEIASPFVAKLITQNHWMLSNWEKIIETLLIGSNGEYLHHINSLIENMNLEESKALVDVIIKIIIQKRMVVNDFKPLLENFKTLSLIFEILTVKLDSKSADYIFASDLARKIILRCNIILKEFDPRLDGFSKEGKLENIIEAIKTHFLPMCKKLTTLGILKNPSHAAETELTLGSCLLYLAERKKEEKFQCIKEVLDIIEKYKNTLKNEDLNLLLMAIQAQVYFQLEQYNDCVERLYCLNNKIKDGLKRFQKIEKKCYSMTNKDQLYKMWLEKLNPVYQKYFDKLEILKKEAIAKIMQGLKERNNEVLNDGVKLYELAYRMAASENGENHSKTMQVRYLLAKAYTVKGFFLQSLGYSSLNYYHKALVLSYKVFEYLKLNVGLYHPKICQCYDLVCYNLLGLCWEYKVEGKHNKARQLFLEIWLSDFSRFLAASRNVIIMHDIVEDKDDCSVDDRKPPSTLLRRKTSFLVLRKSVQVVNEAKSILNPVDTEMEVKLDRFTVTINKGLPSITVAIIEPNSRSPKNIEDNHFQKLWCFINNFLETKDYLY